MQTPTLPSESNSVRKSSFETVVHVLKVGISILGVYWVAIFAATHLPAPIVPTVGSDKLQHMIAFGGLGFLLAWTLSMVIARVRVQVIATILIALTYATLDEWSQQFVVGRTPDIADGLADVCGAVLGLSSFYVLRAAWGRELKLVRTVS